MGLFSGLTDILVGKAKAPKADFSEIEKLMRLNAEFNRTNQNGIFGGWNWSEGPDGTWSQNQSVNPAMQPAVDSFMGRLAQGPGDERLAALEDASFQALMARQGTRARPEARERLPNRSDKETAMADWWR